MNPISSPITYPVYSVVGDRYTFLLTGAQTGGAYAVFDFYVPAGGGTPPHVHSREDEAFLVVDGEFEFVVKGEPTRLGPGGFLLARRDVPHQFRNVGGTPGRMVVTVTPAGFEDFFAEVGTPLTSRDDAPVPPSADDIARLIRVAPKYGVELLEP